MKTPYWTRAIEAAKKRYGFTHQQRRRASGWTTCACGKQNQYLLDGGNAPWDHRLFSLGIRFTDAVMVQDDPTKAATLLAQIEKRATYLLSPNGRKAHQP